MTGSAKADLSRRDLGAEPRTLPVGTALASCPVLASGLQEIAEGCHTLVIQRAYEPDPEEPGGPDAAQLCDLQPEHLVGSVGNAPEPIALPR